MLNHKSRLPLSAWQVILLATVLVAASGCASTRRNVQNSVNADAVFSDRTPHKFGTGGCETTRRSIVQKGDQVTISLDRPEGCSFKSLTLAVGSNRYPMARAGAGFTRRSSGNYSWAYSVADVHFVVLRPIEANDLRGEFGLIETDCRTGGCVTDARVAQFEAARVAAERESAERERDLAAAQMAETPAEINALRERLRKPIGGTTPGLSSFVVQANAAASPDVAVVEALAVLDARMVAFVAAEAAWITSLDETGLRSFLKERSAIATTRELAATEEGLVSAKARLRDMLMVLARSGTDAQREGLLEDEYADVAVRDTAFARLRTDYLQRREFAPLYRLYKLRDDISLIKAAQGFARSADDRRKLEEIAVAKAKNPRRIFDVSGEFASTSVTSNVKENMGYFANFTVNVFKQIRGTVNVKLRPDSPLKLRHGRYTAWVDVGLYVPRDEELRSGILGNKNTSPNILKSETVSVTLSPPHYEGAVSFDFGNLNVGYFQSGSMGGYTAIRLTEDPRAQLNIRYLRVAD